MIRKHKQTVEERKENMAFAKKAETKGIHIPAPRFETLKVFVKGNAPLVIHRFGQKAVMQIRQKEEAGTTAKTKRAARDFYQDFMEARHISKEGWDGIPAAAFRCGMTEAALLLKGEGLNKTDVRRCVFIEADGFDAFDSSPLVRIIGQEPEKFESMVRINNGMSTDISVRPMWKKWGAELRIRFDADMFTKTDVLNLLYRVGCQLGICEGRPSSKKSCGMGWGTFDIVNSREEIEA